MPNKTEITETPLKSCPKCGFQGRGKVTYQCGTELFRNNDIVAVQGFGGKKLIEWLAHECGRCGYIMEEKCHDAR